MSSSPAPTDADLARLVTLGSAGAEDELCRRFAPRVRLYGLRHLRDESAADDLVQTVLETTLSKLRAGEVREPDQVASFVLGVARMQAHAARRRDAREESMDERTAASLATAPGPDPEPLARDRMARCLEALDERSRAVVLLSFYAEQSASDVAGALATTAGNVRVMRHRAIERLRECMGLTKDEP